MDEITVLSQEHEAEYGDRIVEWERESVAKICREVGRIGKMAPSEAKKYDAKKRAKEIEKAIVAALSVAVVLNVKDIQKTFFGVLGLAHNENKYLYEYRGVPFVEFGKNGNVQKIVEQYAKKNGAELLNIAKTKALMTLDQNGNAVSLRKQILKVFDEAIEHIVSGKTDFYSAMRTSVLELGGGGARVDYGGGYTRRLDTVARQNLLYNVKMATAEYNRGVAEELNCDGIEISFSANPRPSHRFMEGKQYAKTHGRTVNGVYYEGAEDMGVYERLYDDYNCHHREMPIILGVSEPTYDAEELARLKSENEKQYTIGEHTGDGYFWSQRMRGLETNTRRAKDEINALRALGGNEEEIAKRQKKIKVYKEKYNEISSVTGIAKQPQRMSVTKK
jgi:hypothetical protein